MNTFKTNKDVRVKTAGGEAQFFIPGPIGLVELSNELGDIWLTVPKGSEITLCASFEKTDTYLIAATMTLEGTRLMNGIALRRMSWSKLAAAAVVPKAKSAPAEDEAVAA
jgi:hypothetical protein